MFDLLKKKLGKFTEKVKQRLDQKARTEAVSEKAIEPEPVEENPEEPRKPLEGEKRALSEEKPEYIEEQAEEEKPAEAPEKPAFEAEPEPVEEEKQEEAWKPAEERPEEQEALPKERPLAEEEKIPKPAEERERPAEKGKPIHFGREKAEAPVLKPRVGIKGRLKAAVTGATRLEEKELKELLWELELALLEADVEQTTAEEICREIKQRLVEKKSPRGKNIEAFVKNEIGEILSGMMHTEELDLVKAARQKKEKPYTILFLGPNGSGKTTSIAKITSFLQGKGFKVIWAAGDTFRAASIEQLETHAARLNVKVVKHQYGADPAAVAFDAVKSAQSKRIDFVLIDSAGRQETNKNLMGELQKISRVIKPDLKLYVGEAFTGQSLLHQAKEYDKIVGIDGFVLTKIDCDSKGGTTISLLYKTGKPILFVGTGQEYKDLEKFRPEFVLKRILG